MEKKHATTNGRVKQNEEFEEWYDVRKQRKNKKKHKEATKKGTTTTTAAHKGCGCIVVWFLSNSEHIFYLFRWRILPRSGRRRAWWGGCSGLGRPLLLRQGRERTRNLVKLIVQRFSRDKIEECREISQNRLNRILIYDREKDYKRELRVLRDMYRITNLCSSVIYILSDIVYWLLIIYYS